MEQRILIVRLSAIGDVVLSTPVLCALRKAFPKAKLGWVVERAGAQLLEGHQDLDDLIVLSKDAFRSVGNFYRAVKEIRRWQPTATIDLQGLTKSSLLAFASGAPLRYGFDKGDFDGRELSRWLNNRCIQPQSSHIVERGLELIQLLGAESTKIEYRLPEEDADSRFADSVVKNHCLDQPFAIVNVGAGWPSKIWPSDRYAAVARYLSSQWGLMSLVLWSGDAERTAAEAVVQQSDGCAALAPATSLKQLRSLIRQAKIFVGSDTGPMHLSVAVETPTVGMIGPMPIERVGPIGQQNRGVQCETLPRSLKSQRKTDCKPMLSIQVEDVCNACGTILSSSKSAASNFGVKNIGRAC
jgi:lipopolysaccharide heptosyltransferase I